MADVGEDSIGEQYQVVNYGIFEYSIMSKADLLAFLKEEFNHVKMIHLITGIMRGVRSCWTQEEFLDEFNDVKESEV